MISSEIVITTWLSQGSRIWPQCYVTRRLRPILYRLHYRESCSPTYTEHNLSAICPSQVVQGDMLVDRHLWLQSYMKKRTDMWWETNDYMHYSEGLDMPGVSGLASAWGYEETRTNQGSRIIYITEKSVRQHAQSTTLCYSLRLACSGWRTGFISTCFYLSKL